MTQKSTGAGWMPAAAYGRMLPKFTINLLVHDVMRSLPFYRDVLGATVRYANSDFAALEIAGTEFMLHADHTYDRHPLYSRLQQPGPRGNGAEIRVLGIDPDALEQRARAAGVKVLQATSDFPHGWRDVELEDPDGYIWAVGVALPES
jgi:uncharacterized glyoxalase superfamily protein PhnB